MACYGSQDYEDFVCTTEIDFTAISDLCTAMPRRLLVSGILIWWMRQHFTNPLNIENQFLQTALWTDDITTTGISIDSVFRYNPAMTEFRPGVFIKPGPWKVIRYGIDDRKLVGTLRDSCGTIKMPTYNTMLQGSHTLFCIAGESAEVEILATEVYRELMQFGPAVRRVFNFLRFQVSDIGEPAILEESKEHFVVPVSVAYGAQEVWKLCPPAVQEINNLTNNLWNVLAN
jgi:hypothetical protein